MIPSALLWCLALDLGCSAGTPASPSADPPAAAAPVTVTATESSTAPRSAELAARVETGDANAKPAASINVDDLVDAMGASPGRIVTKPPGGNPGVLTAMAKEYRDCWKAELERPNGLTKGSGKILVTLKPDGSQSTVAVTGFEKSRSFTECIVAVVKAGKFLPPSEGESVVSFGLQFRAAE